MWLSTVTSKWFMSESRIRITHVFVSALRYFWQFYFTLIPKPIRAAPSPVKIAWAIASIHQLINTGHQYKYSAHSIILFIPPSLMDLIETDCKPVKLAPKKVWKRCKACQFKVCLIFLFKKINQFNLIRQ